MQDLSRLRIPTLQDASEGLDTVADLASQGLARASDGLDTTSRELATAAFAGVPPRTTIRP